MGMMQAAQVRKSSIGGMGLNEYHPNTHHAYTVHSGTTVEQVWRPPPALSLTSSYFA